MNFKFESSKTGEKRKLISRFLFSMGLVAFLGCSVFATRPVQLMSDTASALRAAKEVQADTLSPDLFRQANEWFVKARNEYKFKNFALAEQYAKKAKRYAEDAEFDSIRGGGNRSDSVAEQPETAPSPSPTYDYPKPTGTPAVDYEQRKNEEEGAARRKVESPTPTPTSNFNSIGPGSPTVPNTPPPTLP